MFTVHINVSEWVPIAPVSDIPPGHAVRVEIGVTPVAVFNVGGMFYALDDRCSHAEAWLSEGELDEERLAIECPLHGSTFDLHTGEPLTLPAVEPVGVHHVRIENDTVQVKLADE